MKKIISLLVLMLTICINLEGQNLLFKVNPTTLSKDDVIDYIKKIGYKETEDPSLYEYAKEVKAGDDIKPDAIKVTDNAIAFCFLTLDESTDYTGGMGLSFFDGIVLTVNDFLHETPIVQQNKVRYYPKNNVYVFQDDNKEFTSIVFEK